MRAKSTGLLPRVAQNSAGFNNYSGELGPLESPCGSNPAKCIESDRPAFTTSGASARGKTNCPICKLSTHMQLGVALLITQKKFYILSKKYLKSDTKFLLPVCFDFDSCTLKTWCDSRAGGGVGN